LRRNCFIKQVTEGKREGRIEVTGRRGTRGKQDTGNLKKKHYIALRGELALEEAMELS